MKKILLILCLFAGVSCSTKVSTYPSINFIGGSGMVDQDMTLMKDTTFKIGINSFSTSKYELSNFKLTRISDNYPEVVIDSTIRTMVFNSVFIFPTAEKENSERWIFEITTRDGYKSELSVQIKTIDTTNSKKETITEKVNLKKKVKEPVKGPIKKGEIYTVKRGDTWYHIAKKYKVRMDELIFLNKDIKMLKQGMKIVIPYEGYNNQDTLKNKKD